MDNVPGVSGFMQTLATLFHQFPVLLQIADITIKSIVLITIFLMIDKVVGRKLNNTSRHLLWLNGLFCLAVLPFIPFMLTFWQLLWPANTALAAQGAWFELPVYASQFTNPWSLNWGVVVVVVYLAAAVALLSRLLLATHRLATLRRQSLAATEKKLLTHLAELQHRLNISRKVTLAISTTIESPISYGLFRPQIMLPAQAGEWSESTMTDVLLHELCHIKRLDWLTTLLAYVIASLFWVNPLVWIAARRLREESENCCDTAVLNSGRDDTDYAGSLLEVASSCIHARRHSQRAQNNNRSNRSSHPLVQTMLDQNTLKTRINRVLEENKMSAIQLKRQVKKSVAVLLLLSAGTMGVLGSHQVLYAQQRPNPDARTVDEEMYPLNSIVPFYPRVAAEASIEGWAQVRFTVNADGSVAESSVSIVDAEPADVFNNSAIAAAKQFMFSPRIVSGQPVDVPNVEYVFRYYMTEESERAARQPQ